MSSTHSAQSTQSTQLTQSTSQPSQDSSHDSASLNEAASIFLPQGKTLTENQEQTISSILKRKHTMFLAPTGSGKSIAYWVLPLLAEGTKKMVIVVSPLTALIIDQVNNIRKSLLDKNTGLTAVYVVDGRMDKQVQAKNEEIAGQIRNGNVPSFLFLSPEMFSAWADQFQRISSKIIAVVLDEVHCILHWTGFRKRYGLIGNVIMQLEGCFPVLMLSATVTDWEKNLICRLLNITCDFIGQTSIPSNLYFQTLATKLVSSTGFEIKALEPLMNWIEENDWLTAYSTRLPTKRLKDETDKTPTFISSSCPRVVLFFQSKITCTDAFEEFAKKLHIKIYSNEVGFEKLRTINCFHADIHESSKLDIIESMMTDNCRILFATSAFGLGIDVQDIEHVIFYNHPKMVSDFVQMAGRGGRDGSQCIVTVLVPYTSAPESSESRDRALENLRALPPSAEELLRHFQSKTAGGDGHITSNGFGSDNDDDNNNNSNTNNNKNNSSSKNKNKSKYKNNDNESDSGSEIDDDRDDSTFRPGSQLVRHRTRSYQLRSPSQSQETNSSRMTPRTYTTEMEIETFVNSFEDMVKISYDRCIRKMLLDYFVVDRQQQVPSGACCAVCSNNNGSPSPDPIEYEARMELITSPRDSGYEISSDHIDFSDSVAGNLDLNESFECFKRILSEKKLTNIFTGPCGYGYYKAFFKQTLSSIPISEFLQRKYQCQILNEKEVECLQLATKTCCKKRRK